MKRITQGDIAKKLGFSQMAVSLALRNHPSLPESTREKVRQMAAQMGYRPDPALSSLNAYRQMKHVLKYQATLAWLDRLPDRGDLRYFWITQCFEGAQKRANELGFVLETFCPLVPDDWLRLVRTLRSRNIEGLLLPLLGIKSRGEMPPDFPWEEFCAISVGEPTEPEHHLMIGDQHQSAALAVRELHALGYRKIAITIPRAFADGTEWRFLGGYLWQCKRLGNPPLHFVNDTPGPANFAKDAAKWILRHRPDAVIATGAGDILPALREARLRVPEDIAVAVLAWEKGYPELAAVDQNFQTIGAASIDHLIDLIRRNDRGLPVNPMRYLVKGTWVPAASAPPVVGV